MEPKVKVQEPLGTGTLPIPTPATIIEKKGPSLVPPYESETYDEVIEMYNEVNESLKDKIYMPKEWAQSKLKQIKATSSLDVETFVISETVEVAENQVIFDVRSGDHVTKMNVQFFQDGVIKCGSLNPASPSKFSFELVDKPANLNLYSISEKANLGKDQVEIVMDESFTKVTISYAPFNIVVSSIRDSLKEELLFTMNTKNSLMFDENVSADFSFHSEYIYGLAEHSYNLLLEDTQKERPYRFFNQDVCAYPVGSKNGIYGAVPLILSRKQNSSVFASLYWQNASDTYIDIHKSEGSSRAYWLSERGNLEFYIFVNHSAADHFKGISNVLGHCAMPQYFSLGYHQSRYSYKDQKDVLQVNSKFSEHEIPCDSITLDIDHTNGKRYFTWDKKLYPDPVSMQETLVENGRQLVTICDPHIKVDKSYPIYKEGVQKRLFVKTFKNKNFVGKCWPGDSVYYDYLNEESRDHWSSQYSYEKYKYSTPNLWAWNDMNEPSVFEVPGLAMPLDNLHTFKSKADPENVFQVEHREVHNLYGYLMHKASYNGLLWRNKDQNIRPHVLSRSFFAGSQKYTAIWTGDTRATWPYLQATVPMLLSLSLCGISFCGGDVGGFIGDPEPELAVRWYQLGTFMPYFRGHSECNCKRREPWLYSSKFFNPIKESIRERYKLLPYWYTCFEEHSRTAVPIMRPIWFDQESILEKETLVEQERFMVGDNLLVVPVVEKGQSSIKGFLKGLKGRWYDYYTRREVLGDEKIEVGLDRIGCFVKGGSILPTFDIRSHTKSTQDAKTCNINLHIALDENEEAKGKLYFDDGETFDYKIGIFARNQFDFSKDTLTWTGEAESKFKVNNRVTKAFISGINTGKYQNAFLVDPAGGSNQKIQLIKGAGYILLEFVALASKNWKVKLT